MVRQMRMVTGFVTLRIRVWVIWMLQGCATVIAWWMLTEMASVMTTEETIATVPMMIAVCVMARVPMKNVVVCPNH